MFFEPDLEAPNPTGKCVPAIRAMACRLSKVQIQETIERWGLTDEDIEWLKEKRGFVDSDGNFCIECGE